ncbi:MAG: hypothetical protein ACU83U_15185 [Gammaproteobacteria bacterium]
MTPEQQREQWLKRMLPALAVLVFYFAVISSFVTEKSTKAETQYVQLKQKGIDAAALPGVEQQQRALSEEMAKLEQENKAIHETFAANSSFLSRTGSPNETIEQISIILAENNLQVLDEKRNEKPGKDTLPRSLRDTQQWLKDIVSVEPVTKTALPNSTVTADQDLNIWTIRYVGRYLDNYRALSALIDSETKALPVSLTMQAYKPDPGKQEWLLTLWL